MEDSEGSAGFEDDDGRMDAGDGGDEGETERMDEIME